MEMDFCGLTPSRPDSQVQQPNRRLPARTGGPEWKRQDLCAACQSVDLDLICAKGEQYMDDVSLCISETSTCPLCRFLTSKLQRKDVESQGSVTIGLSRHDVPGNNRVRIRHGDELEYILPMTDGDMLKEPGTIEQYRQIDPNHVDYDMIRKWIAHCRRSHGKPCQMLTATPLTVAKFRLLDCKTKAVVECTKFVEYVALSYVWGSSSNFEGQQEVLSSAVIIDVMRVTLQLGFRYIWIDQLCIDQKDPEDMNFQLGQMNTIYNQASVTIVAAAGEGSSYGLPGVGQRLRTIQNKFTFNGTTWKFSPRLIKYHVGDSKWATRGWTYQEAVFSRRCVIFADDQVFFQCGCMACAEELIEDFANSESELRIFERMAVVESDSGGFLRSKENLVKALEAYSKRELTYDSDVLRAMEGVFGFYAQLETPVEHYWGLPLRWVGSVSTSEDYAIARSNHDDVVGAFLWAMLWEPAWIELDVIKTGLARRHGFPTWSWSGWKVHVRWPYREIKQLERSFTAPVFVETATGGLVELNEEFARSLVSGQSYAALGLTYILRITTKVFDLPFLECTPYMPTFALKKNESIYPFKYMGRYWATRDESPQEGKWIHFVVQKNIGAPERGLVWKLDLTHGGATSRSDLVFDTDMVNLDSMTLRCIVISYDCGMIVQSSNDISKRVGLLRFKGDFFENGRLRSNEYGYHSDGVSWPWTDSVESRDLRDHFPGVVQTVRLG